MITPRTLKGFRDFLPEFMLPREHLLECATGVFRSYGFCPIDTPSLEYLEILQGKGSDETDRQLYKFVDHGGREVGLRFDLTVPLARYVAQHFSELLFPFKRYHIGKVWRGENTQSGRYREFMQCDFDTIGTRSIVSDIEILLIINDLLERIDLRSGGSFTQFKIKVNNRKILTGLLDKNNILDKSTLVLRAVDKIGKIGRQGVFDELLNVCGLAPQQADCVLEFVALDGSNESIFLSLRKMLSGNETGEAGLASLEELFSVIESAGIPRGRVVADVSIARGLDYYTGMVYETFLDELPNIGSVCSGGRYDDLASLYTKQELPGVGGSLGLDRLISAMEILGMIDKISAPVSVFMPFFAAERLGDYLKFLRMLKSSGIGVEFYPESKKIGQQLKYADKRGFRIAIIAGENEFQNGTCQIKDLKTGNSIETPQNNAPQKINEILSSC
ncbi:MAG: histidine--tRNA ligase [Planctomycetaceae bacterium]|jgi:histidyl-tRNA synthetase|nr:histidine--tRNA ligase [Planctomycetaceae bacterium]